MLRGREQTRALRRNRGAVSELRPKQNAEKAKLPLQSERHRKKRPLPGNSLAPVSNHFCFRAESQLRLKRWRRTQMRHAGKRTQKTNKKPPPGQSQNKTKKRRRGEREKIPRALRGSPSAVFHGNPASTPSTAAADLTKRTPGKTCNRLARQTICRARRIRRQTRQVQKHAFVASRTWPPMRETSKKPRNVHRPFVRSFSRAEGHRASDARDCSQRETRKGSRREISLTVVRGVRSSSGAKRITA